MFSITKYNQTEHFSSLIRVIRLIIPIARDPSKTDVMRTFCFGQKKAIEFINIYYIISSHSKRCTGSPGCLGFFFPVLATFTSMLHISEINFKIFIFKTVFPRKSGNLTDELCELCEGQEIVNSCILKTSMMTPIFFLDCDKQRFMYQRMWLIWILLFLSSIYTILSALTQNVAQVAPDVWGFFSNFCNIHIYTSHFRNKV